jgi:cytochrome bd-type quinol oxidase subunit 2
MDRSTYRESLPWSISFGILAFGIGVGWWIYLHERIAEHWLSWSVAILISTILGVQLGFECWKRRRRRRERNLQINPPDPNPDSPSDSN